MGVAPSIDITAEQRKTIVDLLKQHLPDIEVWVYGSRVKWTAKPHSALDMVVFTTPEQSQNVTNLKEAFEESSLPFRVDCFVWDDVPESFYKNIQAEHVVLQEKKETGLPEGWVNTALGDVVELKRGGRSSKIKENGWCESKSSSHAWGWCSSSP